MELHVVSFQWPAPPDYGGVIDVYYKVRALKETGVDVVLHSYGYRERENPELSESPATHSYVYPRDLSMKNMVSRLPFIVATRRNKELLDKLGSLPAGTPIIFEGLHSCAFLDHPSLKDKKKIVRTHNVEHHYYNLLASNTKGTKKIFFMSEAMKLKQFEKKLRHADLILAISPSDKEYFSKAYPEVPSVFIPCFYDDSNLINQKEASPEPPITPFALYHGNLGVEENAAAVRYILREFGDCFTEEYPLKIAGKGCPSDLRRYIEGSHNVVLVDAPSSEEMGRLVTQASVVLLITNQPTGIKLKLLDTLAQARGHILATSQMVADDSLRPFLNVVDTPQEQREIIEKAKTTSPSSTEISLRREALANTYSTLNNARGIISAIEALS